MSPPSFPENALFQSLVYETDGRTAGYRILTDGRYEVKALGDNDWQPDRILTDQQLAAIRTTIDSLPLDGWNKHYGDPGEDNEQLVTWLQIRRERTPHYVELRDPSNHPGFVFDLMQCLATALQ